MGIYLFYKKQININRNDNLIGIIIKNIDIFFKVYNEEHRKHEIQKKNQNGQRRIV